MTRPDAQLHSGAHPRSLQTYTTAWAAAGAAALAVAAWLTFVAADTAAITTSFWLLAAVTAVTELIELDFPWRDRTDSAFTLTEVGVVAALLLLGAPDAVLATILGVTAAQILRRRPPHKLAYNLGHRTVAVAAAAATIAALPTLGPTINGTAVLSLAAAMAVYTTADVLGLIGLLHHLINQHARDTLHDYALLTTATIAATTTIGAILASL